VSRSETANSLDTTPLFDDEAVISGGRLTAQAKVVSRWANETETGDRDDLPEPIDSRVWRAFSVSSAECVGRTRCPVGEDCFAEKARDVARDADVIVTNHAMLALDWIEGVPVLPEYSGVVIDEAHEWIDRATRAATMDLSPAAITVLAGAAARLGDGGDSDRLVSEARDLAAAVLAQVGESDHVRWAQVPEVIRDCAVIIREAARTTLSSLSHTSETRATSGVDTQSTARQRVRAGLDAVIVAIDRLLAADADMVVWAQRAPERISIAPLSIGDVLKARFDQPPVILTSATLMNSPTAVGVSCDGSDMPVAPMEHNPQFAEVARECGIADQPWSGLDVGSPFDYARQGILYVARHLPEPGREGIAEETLDEIAELIEAAGGRSLVLFSSWRAVERAADYLRVRLDSDMRVFVQQRGEAAGPLVERFRDDIESVLLGTIGLWQGVDVPGHTCRLVIIDRIPFGRPDDPILAARQERIEKSGGDGFTEIALPRAATMLAQGVGRLIRSDEDRGVVAILDPRLATRGYGRRIRRALPPLWDTTDPAVVRAALTRL
jgi:ATP-dependent DNA helicase DinG